jgi:hypothetical protein
MLKEVNDSLVLPIVWAAALNTITVLIGILINNARLSDIKHYMAARFNEIDSRFDKLDQRFEGLNRRFERA